MVSTSLRNRPRICGRISSTKTATTANAWFSRRREPGGSACTRAFTARPLAPHAAVAAATSTNSPIAPGIESPLPEKSSSVMSASGPHSAKIGEMVSWSSPAMTTVESAVIGTRRARAGTMTSRPAAAPVISPESSSSPMPGPSSSCWKIRAWKSAGDALMNTWRMLTAWPSRTRSASTAVMTVPDAAPASRPRVPPPARTAARPATKAAAASSRVWPMEMTSATISRWLKASTMPISDRITRVTPPIRP